jgi:hypothetical protein
MKKEEVFSLLKRSTSPQTIYKKQKLDRDDVVDITDFDVVAWLKGEMRMMLDEGIARACLVGDGRLMSDDDKISEDHVRPIANDADLFTIKAAVTASAGATDEEKNASYSTGAIMTLQNVPTVMPNDLCVVIGAKNGTDKENDSGLRQGDFNFTASANKDYVFLLFDHLYAALRIQMKVHADYAALRTIKLKSLQLDTQAGEKKTTKKTTITIKLKANDGSASPIEKLTFTPTGEEINGGLEFWSDTYGEQLTTEFKPFIGHFMPSGITKLILTSTYDVYDTKGNLIRQDCKATNTMVLKDLLTEQKTTERGKRYTVNMTIHPTYLYMLSEPDLDNPTVTIN